MTDKGTSGQSVQKSPELTEGLFLMDGIEGLRSLPRHSVDMLLTDPPYGTTRNFWDVPLPLPELWEAVKWAVKPDGAILFFAQCPYDKVLGTSNLSMLRYRVDTDVITPVTLYAGSEINPDSPATVSFSINGSTYRMNNIVIPSGDSQIAWVKWHTPSEPQDITIYVSTNKGSLSQSTIRAKVVDLSGNDPPDPKATDTMGSWAASSVPSRETKTYAAWSVWWAKWHPYWVWHSTGKNTGYWVDDGWYDYFRDNYSASMTATTRIEPDEKVPTASGDLMKSGYGVTNTVTATVSTSAPLSHYTYGQTAVSYFPEFGYGTYWRLLERLTSGTTARFQFAKNIYSTYNQRVHFSPVWFPDGSYTVNTHVMDIWTPAGMLAMNLTDDVTISGSLYDDWHIAPGNP